MKKNKINITFYIITILIIFLSFILLEPKISVRILKSRKKNIWNNFLKQTLTQKKIDPQAFWKFRDFFCPGYFVFNKEAPTFLTYSCSDILSYDSFTTSSVLPGSDSNINQPDIIILTKSVLIYKKDRNIITLFVLPIEDMKKANGFFDYKEKDKELVKDKYWLNKTIIKL